MKIRLTQEKFAIIDDKNKDLAKLNWCARKDGKKSNVLWYAVRHGKKINGYEKPVIMHRVIAGRMINRELTKEEKVDHINQNGLDNRECNIRITTTRQNIQNARRYDTKRPRKYKGISWNKSANKWQASIRVNGTLIYLGIFEHDEDAAVAYDNAAKKFFGDHCCLNFKQKQFEREDWK